MLVLRRRVAHHLFELFRKHVLIRITQLIRHLFDCLSRFLEHEAGGIDAHLDQIFLWSQAVLLFEETAEILIGEAGYFRQQVQVEILVRMFFHEYAGIFNALVKIGALFYILQLSEHLDQNLSQ